MSEQIKTEESYTYADYKSWPENPRYELIDGVPYAMAGPKLKHQRIVRLIGRKVDDFLSGKECELFYAPFDVRFEDDEETDTVVQPYLMVVCDRAKIRDEGIVGAPDLIIEVLSQSTTLYDTTKKRRLYERAGVKEYWMISPETADITQLVLKDGRFDDMDFDKGTLKSAALPGLEVDTAALFAAAE